MSLSKIIIGGAQFGTNYGVSNVNGPLQQLNYNSIFKYCYKKNINSFDTASNYGNSEKIFGNYIKNNKNQKWNISTKINFNDDVEDQFKKSIKNLKIIPSIIYFHKFTDFKNKKKRSLIFDLCKKYKVKNVGVSIYTIDELRFALKIKNISIIQIPINILDRKFLKKKIISDIKHKKIQIHARSIFLQGMLYLKKFKYCKKDTKNKLVDLNSLLKKNDTNLGELSLQWVSSLDFIKKIIIGIDNLDQLKHNLKSMKNKNKNKNNLIKKITNIKINDTKFLSPNKW